jgi:endonuclease/exonuclease/phosphatase (EEP) superfamily protein YafD
LSDRLPALEREHPRDSFSGYRVAVHLKRLSGSFVAVAVLLVGVAVLYRTVGDRTTWSECLTVWPPLLWCAVLTPRLVILAVQRKKRELGAALVLVAVFLAVTMEWPRVRHREPAVRAGARRLRVVSWNTAGGMPWGALTSMAPDVCFLQEIAGVRNEELRGPWAGWSWLAAFDPGILSRFPLTRLPTRKVGPWTEPLLARLDLPDGRRVLAMNVRLVLPAFVVAAASFEWPPPSRLAEAHRARVRQYDEIAALLRETMDREGVRSVILCGDFNIPGGSWSLAPLTAIGSDVWPRVGRGWGATMTADMPVSRIDQCWVTPDIQPLAARVVRGPSDHRALVVELAIP